MSKKYFDATRAVELIGLRTKEVEVPGEDGAFVIVREMTAMDFAELGARQVANGEMVAVEENFVKLFPDIIARCVLDGDKNPIFTPGQVSMISAEYTEWLTTLAMTAVELSGLTVVESDENAPEKNV